VPRPFLLAGVQLRPEGGQGLERLLRQGDQEILRHEDVDLGRLHALRPLVEAREVEDDEEIVVVLVDLGALLAPGQHVLEVQLVEVEVGGEPACVDPHRALDVEPGEPVRLDALDIRVRALSRVRLARRVKPRAADLGKARHHRSVRPSPRGCSGVPSSAQG